MGMQEGDRWGRPQRRQWLLWRSDSDVHLQSHQNMCIYYILYENCTFLQYTLCLHIHRCTTFWYNGAGARTDCRQQWRGAQHLSVCLFLTGGEVQRAYRKPAVKLRCVRQRLTGPPLWSDSYHHQALESRRLIGAVRVTGTVSRGSLPQTTFKILVLVCLQFTQLVLTLLNPTL